MTYKPLSVSLYEFIPILPIADPKKGFTVPLVVAREIAEAGIDAAYVHDETIATAMREGMMPYKIALAMALHELGYGDLLFEGNRQLSVDDVEQIERHLEFVSCDEVKAGDSNGAH